MNKNSKFSVRILPAVCFLLAIIILFLFTIRSFFVAVYVSTDYFKSVDSTVFVDSEEYFNDTLSVRKYFIDLNSIFNSLIGKRQVNEYYKLDNGQLVYTMDKFDVVPYAEAFIEFNKKLSELNKEMIYVQLPFQINKYDKQLPVGVYDYSNENADEFIKIINSSGAKIFDLRELFYSSDDYYGMFYNTDHHWRSETGFYAFNLLQGYLEQNYSGFFIDEKIKDADKYSVDEYNNFLGSCGRSTGPYYSGYDDFKAIKPKFNVELSVYDENDGLLYNGCPEETVLFPGKLTYKDHYYCDMYSYYMNEDTSYWKIVNNTKNGISLNGKKIMILKDSYSRVMIPYFAYAYNEVDVIDLRLFSGNLFETIKKCSPDIILVSYNPSAFGDDKTGLFKFTS